MDAAKHFPFAIAHPLKCPHHYVCMCGKMGVRVSQTGVEPNVVSYNAAISACEKAGQWLEAIGLFEGMKKSGAPEAQPDMVTYSALLSALATSHQVLS